jgi:RecA/RadA recombinase
MAISENELLVLKTKQENSIKLTKDEKQLLKENNAEAKEKKGKMSFGQRLQAAAKCEYSQLMGDDEVDKFPIRNYIDTGNVLLNAQISSDGRKGMPSGRIWQLSGESSVGKSYLGLETLKNAQKMGYFGILYDSEMANNDKEALKERGIDTEKLLYIPIDTVENLKTSLLNIIDEVGDNDKVFIMVDSIGNLSTRKELEDSIDGAATKDMTRPAQLKALFRTCTLRAGVKNIPIIVVNHTYATIGGFFSGGQTIAGGGGSLYNSSIISQFSKAQEKGADGKTSGALITSTNIKCRTAKEKTKVKFTIDFEDGLTKYSGLELFCTEEKLIGKEGRSTVFAEKTGFKQGEKYSKLTDELWEEFLEKYLYVYLTNKFSYSSVFEELELGEDDE